MACDMSDGPNNFFSEKTSLAYSSHANDDLEILIMIFHLARGSSSFYSRFTGSEYLPVSNNLRIVGKRRS